ncbi:MAG: alpha/beta fold hydrolase [Candidatus Cyclobacteriaceae bacterium M3_2C_046]
MKKRLIKAASELFPDQFAHLAFRQITNPQVKKLRPHELEVLQQATQGTITYKGYQIKTYVWNVKGTDEILLIHGWEGQAGNFADIILHLIHQDFKIYAFDGPSHGFSSKGPTSLFEFTIMAGTMMEEFSVNKLISHSFGSVPVTYSLMTNPDLRLEKYVLLTTPDKFTERIDQVSSQIGFSESTKNKLIQLIESETKMNISQMNVSEFVKNIQVDQALIMHDVNDKVIPISQAKNVHLHWAQSVFQEITGTGHFRILRDEKVIKQILRFLNE